MTTKILLALTLALCWSMTGWAADTFHPLDVKPGQWESSTTMNTNGAPLIPPEVLARMTPDQRAKLEERAKALSGRTTVNKTCVKREKLDKPFTWGHEDKACTYALGESSGTVQEIHVECNRENRKSTGTIRVEALDSENIKGSVQMTLAMGDRTREFNTTFTAKYVGPACGTEQ